MRDFIRRLKTQSVRFFCVLLAVSSLLLAAGCVQVEISGLPTEHYLIVQPPTDNAQLLDCTANETADLASTTELNCHPIGLTVHR